MNPVKQRSLNPAIAALCHQPLAVVETVLAYYWKTVRDRLIHLAGPNVTIDNFGTFQTMWRALNDKIAKTEQMMAAIKPPEGSLSARYTDLQSQLDDMIRVREEMQREHQRKLSIKHSRYGITGTLEEA